MDLNLTTISHNFSSVKRQIQDEYKNISLYFILHRRGQRSEILKKQEAQILDLPNGREIYKLFELQSKENKTQFLGLIRQPKTFLKFIAKDEFTAVGYINLDHFENEDYVLQHFYNFAWHAITTYRQFQEDPTQLKIQDTIIFANKNTEILAKHNMLADAFGAIAIELSGKENFIKKLAKNRAISLLKPIFHFDSDLFPYPIIYESCYDIYDDLKSKSDSGTGFIKKLRSMIAELETSYGEAFIKDWLNFAQPAQDMSWMNYKEEEILGSAIHINKDQFVADNARFIGDLLNIEASAAKNFTCYNPFGNTSENESEHYKTCEKNFFKISRHVYTSRNYLDFYKEAYRQCEAFTNGNSLGFCVTAMIAAGQAYKNAPESEHPLQNACSVFYEDIDVINWDSIEKASSFILSMTKNGKIIHPEQIGLALEKVNDDFAGLDEFIKKELQFYLDEKDKPLDTQGAIKTSEIFVSKQQEEDTQSKQAKISAPQNPEYEDKSPFMDYMNSEQDS